MKLVFNKRSGAVVMSPDSEGLGAAVVAGVSSRLTQSNVFHISLYTFISRHCIMVSRWTSVCPSVRPSVFRFRITCVNINGFSPNLVCALILWRSGFGLLMGKFRQILTELSARDTPIFSFPDDNLSKHQWIFTKLGMCIDIMKSGLGLLIGKFRPILTELSARDMPIFSFPDDNLSKSQGSLTKLSTCIDMKEIWFRIANGQISPMF